ncbi:conjugal transfer protein TraF [Shewanella olleyana]|uniref:conjugal transfer protein TraF n=1 Tax=Shewanella olleyana TaxID=135626 RepID=UPI00200E09C4|nr:conjugal transfer protein TraF [Shewanella olleyana]MCL1068603.1 conjugal transfer protein TraF [Shewanella olleyana]
MKRLALAFCLLVLASNVQASGLYFEARSESMGGTGVAASNRIGASFINPALLAILTPHATYTNEEIKKTQKFSLLLPAVGAEGDDSDDMIDKFDSLQDSYDGLEDAINNGDTDDFEAFRDDLVIDLESLKGNTANVSAGVGAAIVIPNEHLPMAVFYKSYIDAIGVADIAQSDIDTLNTLDPLNPPTEISDLDSQGVILAGGVTDFGVALSFPLSIVNMPVRVGISPKFQRIDTYHYSVNANNFDADDFDDDKYRNDENLFNLDIGVAFEPMDAMTIGLSARNLFSKTVETVEAQGREFHYQVEPLITAGVAYDWTSVTLTTDIDLIEQSRFKEFDAVQYWRVGGEVKATDWLSLRMGYRHDLKDNSVDIYSFGTGFAIGQAFKLDMSGSYGEDDAIGAVLQTSYHF